MLFQQDKFDEGGCSKWEGDELQQNLHEFPMVVARRDILSGRLLNFARKLPYGPRGAMVNYLGRYTMEFQ